MVPLGEIIGKDRTSRIKISETEMAFRIKSDFAMNARYLFAIFVRKDLFSI